MNPCPQCQSDAPPVFRAKDYNRSITDEHFTYHRCPACDLVFLAPIPQNLGDYYPASYYQFPDTVEAYLPLLKFQQYKIELVQQFKQGGRLLEVGPGPGDFALLAKRAGFDVDAIEMDERCCQFLRDVVQVNVVNSDDPAEAIKSMGQYDVIALWHVIEHLPDPWAVLDALVEHVAPGGIILLAAPNPASLQFKLFGRFWTHLDAPRHLELIPAELLTGWMEKRGWQQRLMTTTDKGSLGWNRFGWQYSLSNLFGRKISARIPGAIAYRLFAPFERHGLRGSTYTAVYQR